MARELSATVSGGQSQNLVNTSSSKGFRDASNTSATYASTRVKDSELLSVRLSNNAEEIKTLEAKLELINETRFVIDAHHESFEDNLYLQEQSKNELEQNYKESKYISSHVELISGYLHNDVTQLQFDKFNEARFLLDKEELEIQDEIDHYKRENNIVMEQLSTLGGINNV